MKVLFVLQKGDLGFTLSSFSTKVIYSVPLTAITTFFLSFVIIFALQKYHFLIRAYPNQSLHLMNKRQSKVEWTDKWDQVRAFGSILDWRLKN